MAAALSILCTLSLGAYVSTKIQQSAVAQEAASAALYMGHFVSPLIQELATNDHLSERSIKALNAVLQTAALPLRVKAIKIWSATGRLIYSSNPVRSHEPHEIDDALEQALRGQVSAEFNEPDPESRVESAGPNTLLEVYAPIHAEQGSRVIAVAEFYEESDELLIRLNNARLESWFVTAVVVASICLAFWTLISDGSRTIERQEKEAQDRIVQLSDAMRATQELRRRIERGARNVIEENERFLKTVGSELHDGPAQMIGMALMRLDALETKSNSKNINVVRLGLNDAMRDIRAISSGLILSNFENQSLSECLRNTVRSHEVRTRSDVKLEFGDIPEECAPHLKICLCRFVQEGLTNAFRHAGGRGQRVLIALMGNGVRAAVIDTGPGMPANFEASAGLRLGLVGLRARFESIRGTFEITSTPGMGTTLSAWMPLSGATSDVE
jgi:signal transduction histidine kinase